MRALLARHAGPIHVIADNAGPELLADLLLLDTLIAGGDRIVLHCKPWPMFVSDALEGDVLESVHALRRHSLPSLSTVGERLQGALDDGSLTLAHDSCWGEPRHFDALEPAITDPLARAKAVITKGDLNYRRFVGDLDWPIDVSASEVTRTIPFGAYALRVLKSDALVGVSSETASRASAVSPAWRTNGSHALVQQLGRVEVS